MNHLDIRPMSLDEMALAVEWAAREGWNPGLCDAAAFHAADPDGFLVGSLEGEPVAMISAVRYPPDFGFVGLYIVHPAMRGHGYGIAIWRKAMERLDGCTIGLDGVVAQQENYRRSGFVLAYNNVRYEGDQLKRRQGDRAICPVSEIAWPVLLDFDRRFFPARREAFLRGWLAAPDHIVLALDDGEGVRGYGAIRPCRSGFKVGPLFADSAEVASRLLAALTAATPVGSRIQLDMPTVNTAAVTLARSQGMAPIFETARMYRGPAPRIDLAGQFGVTTFELG